VIITSPRPSPAVYVLSRQGGSASSVYASIHDALRAACDFAKEMEVNVWYLDDDQAYQLIAECRKMRLKDS
jgi:hypothetical protein